MGQGYNDRLDETLGNKDGKESSKKQSMGDRRHESEAMDGSSNRFHAMGKVLKHMGGRGLSSTDRGIEGLGDPNAEGKFI